MTDPRGEVELRRAAELARPSARRPGPVAVYDTVTEGMTGRQFLRTWRWFGFTVSAVLFAVVCVFLSQWQFDRGQQATTDNSIVATNFAADPVPIGQALPTLASYDPTQNWQRVSATGVYQGSDELVVRNRSNAGENGFEVVTPLQLADGTVLLVDRGWVAPADDDALAPGAIPPPPTGTVDVVVQLRPSEAPFGTGGSSSNQIQSVTLPRIAEQLGSAVYTGAYGVLESQSPAAATGLRPIQTAAPVEDVGTHYSYAVQWLAFGVLGFVVLGMGMRREYRRLNSDDPEERQRASERLKKNAKKPFTDEELEDEEIDGYLPLTRWGLPGGAASAPALPARAPAGGATGSAGGATGSAGGAAAHPPRDVYVLDAPQPPADPEPDHDRAPEPDHAP